MRNTIFIFIALFLSTTTLLFANEEVLNRLHRYQWGDLEVVWLEDDRLPLFSAQIYFADGALNDHVRRKGETEFMFGLLSEGTNRYRHNETKEFLEFFGVDYGAIVNYEYSSFRLSGLLEHMAPSMEMVCHLFRQATFPQERISHHLSLRKANLKSSIRNHGWLANRAFREISMAESIYAHPTSGKINDLDGVTSSNLISVRDYFNDKVKKKLYLTGPKEVLGLRNIMDQHCGWTKQEEQFVRKTDSPVVIEETGPEIHFVEVPSANQAQIRIGRYLNKGEFDDVYAMYLANNFIGGGFTSRLMREIRVRRGLTYSIGSMAAPQRDYGRVFISTFTPSERVVDLLEVIENTINTTKKEVDASQLEASRGNLIGSHPFQFESSNAVLSQIMTLEHQERSMDELTQFPERVKEVSANDVKKYIDNLFSFERQVIVILGEKSVYEGLKEAGYENIHYAEYSDFL